VTIERSTATLLCTALYIFFINHTRNEFKLYHLVQRHGRYHRWLTCRFVHQLKVDLGLMAKNCCNFSKTQFIYLSCWFCDRKAAITEIYRHGSRWQPHSRRRLCLDLSIDCDEVLPYDSLYRVGLRFTQSQSLIILLCDYVKRFHRQRCCFLFTLQYSYFGVIDDIFRYYLFMIHCAKNIGLL